MPGVRSEVDISKQGNRPSAAETTNAFQSCSCAALRQHELTPTEREAEADSRERMADSLPCLILQCQHSPSRIWFRHYLRAELQIRFLCWWNGMETTQTDPGESCIGTSECPTRSVERLFPFVLRARILLVGRETLRRSKSKLHFVLITEDISESVRAEILADFAHYPVVQHYTARDLERFFPIKGAKAIGFAKSGLARSLYAELKQHRINRPPTPSPQSASPPPPPRVRRAARELPSRRRERPS